ncbi:Outer membrane porin protein 32 [compost metagenome]
MLKRKIAVAIGTAICASAAHAQTSVQLYGIVDTALYYQTKVQNVSGGFVGLLDGAWKPSIYGMRGKEDLGGGLSAFFNLQGGFSSDTGNFGNSTGGIFGRLAYLGLKSEKLGSVAFGLQHSPFFLTLYESDPRSLSHSGSQLVPFIQQFGLTGVFDPNSVVYQSPDLYGFNVKGSYSFGEVPGSMGTGQRYSASIEYDKEPVLVNAAIYRAKAANAAASDAKGWTVGAGYKFGDLVVKANFANYNTPTGATPINNLDVLGLGLAYKFTPAITGDAGVYLARNRNNHDDKSLTFAVGGEYHFSKRTLLFTQIGLIKNDGAMQMGFAVNAGPTLTVPRDATTVAAQLGIRHSF